MAVAVGDDVVVVVRRRLDQPLIWEVDSVHVSHAAAAAYILGKTDSREYLKMSFKLK